MTFREFNLSMMRHPVLGRLLPLECRRTYPRLEQEGKQLCASFVGFRMKPAPGGAEVLSPAYYLKVTYPGGAVRAFVKLPGADGPGHLMKAQTQQTIRDLAQGCDEVLRCFEEQREDLQAAAERYNALLDSVLEPEQLAVLNKMARLWE